MLTQFVARPRGVVSTIRRLKLQQSGARVREIFRARLLPERQAVPGVFPIGLPQDSQGAEHQNPNPHVSQIGAAGKLSAKDLGARLLLEKSTISRLVRSLDVSGVVRELRSKRDRRIKYLQLTRKGNKTLASITGFAEQQVAGARSLIDQNAQRNILSGLETYSAALRASRNAGETAEAHSQPTISTGYKPGLIGRIVEMHATSYSKLVGFGAPSKPESPVIWPSL